VAGKGRGVGRRRYWVAKRAVDVAFSSLALVLLSPLMLAVAVAVWVGDPKGGPLFRQERVGRGGRPFTMYKFRSMVVGAEAMLEGLLERNEMDGPAFKVRDDPRVTRVGRFLRQTSLDELPQFYNVLRGDMSLVGPRPPLPGEWAGYTEEERRRLWVTPGLTCFWQVTPRRNSVGFKEWLAMDLRYIEARGPLTDLAIVCKTVLAMANREGV